MTEENRIQKNHIYFGGGRKIKKADRFLGAFASALLPIAKPFLAALT